jgi:hypothetical protein
MRTHYHLFAITRNFMIKSLSYLFVGILLPATLCAHGPGHIHRQTGVVSEEVDLHAGHDHAGHDHSKSGKSFYEPVLEKDNRWWGASLTTGWESRHVHYGVDETGTYGAYTTELSVTMGNFIFGAWSGFGVGNDYQEWDFTAAYNIEVGPVFIIPGYNFRYTPGGAGHDHEGHEEEHDDHSEEGHDDHAEHDEHESHDDHASHEHGIYGNEIFLVLGTTAIPYVTPSAAVITNLNNTPGTVMEFRLDGEVPIVESVSLQPYALMALNFGYNTKEYYGWNNFQFGIQANWQINRVVSAFAGVNYSVAMAAMREIDQGNVVWANVGVTFAY